MWWAILKLSDLKQGQYSFCSQICNLGGIQWGWLISDPGGFRVGNLKSGGWDYVQPQSFAHLRVDDGNKQPECWQGPPYLSSTSPQCGWISRTSSLRKRAQGKTYLVWPSIRSHVAPLLSCYIHQDSHKGPHNLKGKKYRLCCPGWGGPFEWALFRGQKGCHSWSILYKLYMFCFNYFVVITYL